MQRRECEARCRIPGARLLRLLRPMNTLRTLASQWLVAGTAAVRIQIVNTRGSTPQAAGAMMLVSAGGTAGTIGGGHLEWQATASARELLVRSRHAGTAGPPIERSYALGPSLGQCCGGALTLRFEFIDANLLTRWPDDPVLFDLHLFGMGHVAQALVRSLLPLNCRINWHDSRPEQVRATRALFADCARSAQVLWHRDERHDGGQHPDHIDAPDLIDEAASISGESAAPEDAMHREPDAPRLALVMTHRHDLDFELCRRMLADQQWAFVGLIGSMTKRTRFLRRLEQMGMPASQRARLCCPIGLAGIQHKQPEVLAISIAAQLLQVCRTASPSPMARSLEYADV